jgi:hypothetical protein
VPRIVSVKSEVTALVWIAKFAEVAPVGTGTLAGTTNESLGSLRANATTAPPQGAGAVKWTVPIRVSPPTMLGALKLMEDREADALFLGYARTCAWSSAALARTRNTMVIRFFINFFPSTVNQRSAAVWHKLRADEKKPVPCQPRTEQHCGSKSAPGSFFAKARKDGSRSDSTRDKKAGQNRKYICVV